ncbi:16S rRNA (cytosine(1402)-N(4))-methyltransferase RsmH [Candidatus Falkowbacteria bacterium]|jgi:16S rRNA (cytosine1402-N4)-methyltransferase|nr:16S rRNA (cytosine(1402)-N(4))-methyltransferase RsmH [Candidatus Falkowbacteria bacterium]MBT4433543.1 16S rRNA (cytosine(1402)-N(4))-methyltransferase RsmH [Candidatus Falkowbacteria bacterium]
MKDSVHKSVLLEEAVESLNLKPGQRIVDCTLGGGGHARAILEKIEPSGKLLAIDADKEAIKRFKTQNTKHKTQNLILVQDNFVNLKKIVKNNNFYPVDGIIADFGFSSDQIEDEERGFSFLRDAPLDMRYDIKAKLSAEDIVNKWSESELVKIFEEYGEEWLGKKIAKKIIEEREKKSIKTTFQLSDVIQKVKKRRGKIHPATKIFQALRIAVNDELGVIERFLPQAVEVLNPGGRLVIITFHSLEDRIVKYFFRSIAVNIHNACRVKGLEGEGETSFSPLIEFKIKLINKKVIKPKWAEIKNNKRARSAKMRVVEKV